MRAGVRFSLVLAKNPAVNRAIAAIAEDAWTPVRYPGSVTDPDTGQLISDAESPKSNTPRSRPEITGVGTVHAGRVSSSSSYIEQQAGIVHLAGALL